MNAYIFASDDPTYTVPSDPKMGVEYTVDPVVYASLDVGAAVVEE